MNLLDTPHLFVLLQKYWKKNNNNKIDIKALDVLKVCVSEYQLLSSKF